MHAWRVFVSSCPHVCVYMCVCQLPVEKLEGVAIDLDQLTKGTSSVLVEHQGNTFVLEEEKLPEDCQLVPIIWKGSSTSNSSSSSKKGAEGRMVLGKSVWS